MSAIKLALAARRLREQGGGADLRSCEPIAVIGMGCRLPGGINTPDDYWRLLESGTDAVREVPATRWDVDAYFDPDPRAPSKISSRWAGMLDQLALFDAGFFGIAPREAASMDPQQRLLLEVSWDALNDAGRPPESLGGSATGVFFALYNSDYARLLLDDVAHIDGHASSGTAHGIAPGRLSYLLNLRGPSMAIDTACSSSLVAVHLACQSLRLGECSLAVAGGANVIIAPEESIALSKWGMLAPDGRCKTFDAAANGFVRGEGCGVIVLKRLADALADGDPIHGLIRGSAVNQDGRSTVLTAPNGLAQQAVLRQALENARVESSDIGYVEAHGTGTALGDPIEVEALGATIGAPRNNGTQCRLGSVKTNIGHLEAAAGIAGLIKVLLALRHEKIPPHLHFKQLNPLISLEGTCLSIGGNALPWPSGSAPRFAGVSSFGFGGTNAHIVLEEAPRLQPAARTSITERSWLLPLSASNPTALLEVVERMQRELSTAAGRLADTCYTAGTRRWHFPARVAFVGANPDELIHGMEQWQAQPALPRVLPPKSAANKTAFVFSGHGSQWVGMGRSLYEREKVFRTALEACDAAVRTFAGWSVIEALTAPEDKARLDDTEIFQPVLFSLQTALSHLWALWGISPDAVIGHSVGEIAAAHVAGVLTLDEAASLVVLRGRLMQRAISGSMVAIPVSGAEAQALISRLGLDVSVAAINAPRSTTLSGPSESIEAAVLALNAQGISTRRLSVNRAFHSPLMAPCADDLYLQLLALHPAPGTVPLYSTVDGRARSGATLDATYWAKNVREPVQFADAVDAALRAGCSTFIEIAPHAVLAGAVQQCCEAAGKPSLVLGSMRRAQDGQATMLAALGSLYTEGRSIEWQRIYPSGRCVPLPPYPWQREPHWLRARPRQASKATDAKSWPGAITRLAPHAGLILEVGVSADTPGFIGDHRLFGIATVPFTAMIDLALRCAQAEWSSQHVGPAVIDNMAVDRALVLDDDERRIIQCSVKVTGPGRGEFQLFSRPDSTQDAADWTMHASGSLSCITPTATVLPVAASPSLADARFECPTPLDVDAHYRQLHASGVEFGPVFRRMTQLWQGLGAGLAQIAPGTLEGVASAAHGDPTLLDACLQAVTAAYPLSQTDQASPFVPVSVQRISLAQSLHARWSYARVRSPEKTEGTLVADIWLFADSGEPIGSVEGLRLSRVARSRIEGLLPPKGESLYVLEWERQARTRTDRRLGPCLLLADAGGRAAPLAEVLSAVGAPCTTVIHGTAFKHLGTGRYEIRSDVAGDFRALVEELAAAKGGSPANVVHCWGLDLPPASAAAPVDSGAQTLTCGSAVLLLKALRAANFDVPPRVWFVTRRAVSAGTQVPEPTQSPLHGFARVAALEYPEFNCTTVDVDTDLMAALPEHELLAELTGNDGGENQIALTAGERRVARLRPISLDSKRDPIQPRRTNQELRAPSSGVLEDLRWSTCERRAPAAGELEIEVSHAGLNFRDVLTALKVVPGYEGLGAECVGRVIAVGEGVKDFEAGDEVMALAIGGVKSFVTVPAMLAARPPAGVAAGHAAGLPIIFLTALYAFRRVSSLKSGDKVLIHAAAGGVGYAALQLARLSGAEIFATAGTPEKRALVKSWGAHHVLNSRTVEFAAAIETLTGGTGLDVVLNSLTGEFAARSLSLVRPGGAFIELGKRDLLDPIEVARRHRGVRYCAFDIAEISARDPGLIQSLLGEMTRMFAAREVEPPPMACYAHSEVSDAFRTMAQGRHTGKILIRLQSVHPERHGGGQPELSQAAYVITGGLGALGLHLARWLVARGATRIALFTRRDRAHAAEALQELRAAGVHAECYSVDVADRSALQEALSHVRQTMGAVRGVLHAAGVLEDATIEQIDWTRFQHVLAPKMDGAWNLHALTRNDPLEFFVLFSSLASVLGWSGQANYAAANAFLDALAHHRRAIGLPANSINWGPWADAGMAATLRERDRARLAERGLTAMSVDMALGALERILQCGGAPQILALSVDWPRYAADRAPALLQHVLPRTQAASVAKSTAPNLMAELALLPALQRWPRIVTFVERHAAQALGLQPGKNVDPQRPLHDMGLDSLMSVELRNALAASLGKPLSATLLFDYPTIETLARYLATQVLELEPQAGPAADADADRSQQIDGIRNLSDEEAEAALLRELDGPTASEPV
jgi:acyl transferase domain-containing protein/NADPH:quinone reductase-like Zn-dependent oxidoreductase/NAD(P)-dependent dehydrogenase (short-subunit alcohol dehydrogenase family)/acyl carrier protein